MLSRCSIVSNICFCTCIRISLWAISPWYASGNTGLRSCIFILAGSNHHRLGGNNVCVPIRHRGKIGTLKWTASLNAPERYRPGFPVRERCPSGNMTRYRPARITRSAAARISSQDKLSRSMYSAVRMKREYQNILNGQDRRQTWISKHGNMQII